MQILTLVPGPQALRYAVFAGRPKHPECEGVIRDYRGAMPCHLALLKIQKAMQAAVHARSKSPALPAAIGIRVPFGGTEFPEPVAVDADVLRRLETLTPAAPLHIPALLELLQQCTTHFPGVPQVLTFDTAFFADLPEREHLYALDAALARTHGLRRFGYCGLQHAAAWQRAARTGVTRVISLCLEPQPELAAIQGGRPVYVTSGITPLEGLPGQTTCGDLDPGLVMLLAEELHCGPERLNTIFTRESGLKGLTGSAMTLDELFAAPKDQFAPAREVMCYRILQACGMAMAAMGGVDALVISGRYAVAGRAISAWLKRQVVFQRQLVPVAVHYVRTPVERIVAEQALLLARSVTRRAAA
jgi:acetate kinase